MSVDTDDMIRMLVEIQTGKQPVRADSNEEAAMRERLQRECDAIEAKGWSVEIPSEIAG